MNISLVNPLLRRSWRTISGLQCLLFLVLTLSCTFSVFSRVALSAPGDISTVAGGGPNNPGNGGPATSASLGIPAGVARDAAGNLYIAEFGAHRIRKVDTSGIISTFAGTGVAGFSGDGGPAVDAALSNPNGIVLDSAGNLYIADGSNHRVRRVNASGIISTFVGTEEAGFSGDGGPATSASLAFPTSMNFDGAGNLYIADSTNHNIRKVDTSGIISTVAGTGTAGFSGDGGPATSATLSFSNGVSFDRTGNLYIADYSNNRIRKVNTSGVISTFAGTGAAGFSGDGGPATSATLNGPVSVASDGAGNLYIADYSNNRIRRVNASGIISTIAGTEEAGFSGDGGPATGAALNGPIRLSFDNANNLYFSDIGNGRVRRLESIGVPAPSINSFAPTRGPVGTKIVITGTGFVNVTAVNFNGTPASSFTVDSATQITATVATGSATGKITITTAGSSATSTDNFTLTEVPSLVVNTVIDNSTDSDDLTSLREAINFANSDADSSTITFDSKVFAGKQTLTLGQNNLPPFTSNVTVSGPTAAGAGVTILGKKSDRSDFYGYVVFQTNSGTATLSALTVTNSDFAIYGQGGTTIVQGCTVSGSNTGILSRDSSLTVRNSTVAGNSTGVINFNSTSDVTSSTFSGNGNGIFNSGDGAITVSNSIVTGNTGNNVSNITDKGFNLIGVDAKLGPLQDNGGPTQTFALLSGSPAINAGSNALIPDGVTTDQRGTNFPRIVGGTVDIGAFESVFVAPVLSDSSVSTNEDTTFTFAVDSFDSSFSDANSGDTLQSVRIDSLPANGTLLFNAVAVTAGQVIARADLGKLTFVPATNFNGSTSFDFNASDGALFAAKSARLTVNVTPVNDVPQNSVPDAQSTNEDTALILNDPTQWSPSGLSVDDPDSATLTLTLSVDHGTLTLSQTTNLTFTTGDGTADATIKFSGDKSDINSALRGLSYSPDANFNGSDTLTLNSSDGALSDTDTVAITVNAVNDAPIATNGSATTSEDAAVTIDAKPLVSDLETVDASLTYTVVSAPDTAQGSVKAGTTVGTFVFTPALNFNGTSSFTYRVTDTGDPIGTPDNALSSADQTITITVSAVNDAPNFNVGAGQTVDVDEDAGSQLEQKFATGISAGAGDESGQTLSFTVTNSNNALFAAQPSINAAGDLSYRAKDDASGTATVSVTLKDDGGVLNGGKDTSATQTFSITVNAVNDAPIALADSYLTDQNTTLTVNAAQGVLANDSDIDSTNLSAVLDQTVSRGTLTLNANGSFSFVPERNFRGTTAFSYHISDGTLNSKSVNVTLGVNATPQPIPFGVSISPKAPTTGSVLTATPVILDSEANGTSYSYAWSVGNVVKQNGPSNSFDLSIAGNGDKGQRVSVLVTATRGIDGGTATNFVDVRNSAPFAFSQSGAAKAGVAQTFTLRGADLDAEVLTYKSVGGPTNGTATIVNNADGTANLTYTARRDFGGVEVIRFVSIDESGRPSQPATLSVNVTRAAPAPAPNRAPSANNVTASTRSGVLVKIALSGSDPDGDALTFKRVGGPTNGTGEIQRDSDGVFKMFYTPRAGFVGNEVIRFVALDSAGKPSPVATMTINVTGTNTPSAGNA